VYLLLEKHLCWVFLPAALVKAQVKEGAVQCCAKRIGSIWTKQLRYLVLLEPKKCTPQVGWGKYELPPRSLTDIAPEKLPKPNRKGSSSNHHVSGSIKFWWCKKFEGEDFAVSFWGW